MAVYHHALDYYKVRTALTLIGGELKTMPAFINVSAGWRCRVNKPTACLTLDRFVVRRFVGNFVLVWMGRNSYPKTAPKPSKIVAR